MECHPVRYLSAFWLDMVETQEGYSIRIEGQERKETTLFLSGRIALQNLKQLMADIGDLPAEMKPAKLSVDLSGVNYMDSSGALALMQLKSEFETRSIPFAFVNMPPKVKDMVALLEKPSVRAEPLIPERKHPPILEQIGEAGQNIISDFVDLMTFAGELLIALWYSFRHPRSVRWNDLLHEMKKVGVDGFPIVSLISILLGLIMAFMSSLQLKQFGANVYVASLVALAMVRELGPIMTAILVAGRSGSSFAAEIGAMMVNEEVSALVTMGFDPIRFLAVPKILAAMIVVPLLTLYADFFAIIGGLIVGVLGLDLTVYTYIEQTRISITVFDIVSGLLKAVVFAVLVAGIGCQRGLSVRGGAEAVGTATTSAVVSAIFLIIVADSAFAILLHYVR